ncbi:hypothetical protein DRP04_11580 [Archaeoglobales archaeon]|nr:MAG: hypothetical protein DRP04_11580 [Archaeoglobales archaeon]
MNRSSGKISSVPSLGDTSIKAVLKNSDNMDEWERALHYHFHHTLPKKCPNHLDFLRRFHVWLLREGLASASRYRYVEIVGDLCGFLERKGKRIEDLTLKDLEGYFAFLAERGVKDLRKAIIVIKRLLRYLGKTEIYARIKVPRVKEKMPDVLPREDVLKILENLNLKHRALFALVYETGCRISEALSLKIKDVSLEKFGFAVYFRKSKSEERTVLVIEFADILRKWLEEHPARNDPEAFVFYGRDPYEKMARSNAVYRLKHAATKAGLKTKVYPHLLRHTRATELYGKLNEKEMMIWFGWRTRKMIDVYSRLKPEQVHEKYKQIVGVLKREEGELKHITLLCTLRQASQSRSHNKDSKRSG